MAELTSESLAVCSWSLRPKRSDELVAAMRRVGLSRTQLAMTPTVQGNAGWERTLEVPGDAGVEVVSGMMTTIGEDYSTLESIRRTGGIVPDDHWEENQRIACAVAELTERMQLTRVSFHAGFIPHDPTHETYITVRERVAFLADLFGDHGSELLLETGQETAADLLRFLADVNRTNLRVNFDPADMLLYGMGDPIEAMRSLMPLVSQVHIKDALPSEKSGERGTEVAVGEGVVPWAECVRVLREFGYSGDLVIEREAGDDREFDVRRAAEHLGALL